MPQMTREYHKGQIADFVWVYFEKLLPVFEHIEADSDTVANDFYESAMNSPAPDDYVDGSEFADAALHRGIAHYHMLSLGRYTLTASWHATLYQFFEQQLRLFLFREISHTFDVPFPGFCTDMRKIEDTFSFHNLEIAKLRCWNQIKELRLLSNVIKHGDGQSTATLRNLNPQIFRVDTIADYLELYRSTLLEETLAIDDQTLRAYVHAVSSFWDELPERSFSDEL